MSSTILQLEEGAVPAGVRTGTRTGGFVLTSDDIEILRLISEYRFLRREHVSALTGRHAKRIHRRLLKLESYKYLSTLRLPQQKFIYGIGRAGFETLVEQGIAEPMMLGERLRSHELSELFLKHEMMIVDIHVLVHLACRGDSPIRLSAWREGKGLYDSVQVADHKGTNRLPVRPDAFFTLVDSRRPEGANRANFMLEADRSTASHTRFQEKIRAYWGYVEQGLHEQKLRVRGFRVLTVTLTDARARNLSTLAASLLPERARKYFYFVPLSRLTASSDPIGEASCYSARAASTGELQPLVPAPNQLQKE